MITSSRQDQPLEFLLSGPGLIGQQHAQLVQKHSGCSLAAVVAPDREENVSYASSMGVPIYSCVGEAIESRRFDAAIISSPNLNHAEQASACIARRIPVLIEKPLTDDLMSARRLAEQAEAEAVPVLVGHHRTYSPLLKTARSFLQSEDFGTPVALQGSAVFYKPKDYFEAGPWRTRIGGGPILINFIHEVGLMRFFFGEIVSVFGDASNKMRGFEVEDTVAITLRFENGALGTFLLSDAAASANSWEMTSGENPRYPHHPDINCYHFAGSNGSLDFPSMHVRFYRKNAEPSWWSKFQSERKNTDRADPLHLQLDHFVDVIRGEASPRVSARDGYRNMLVVQALKDSIASGEIVQIAPDAS
ncbi:Gfo/Idh/MocA family protein [Bradyrhizobium sp. WSM1253]|uniref:Gfo/Idh/MocA family protein n=1 Tax=Bradyrhizobium sp. WSM1253 TaxID=319003 RepID=UPI00025D2E12|nr:Gfo/Idh/MocA family oxidoreductase [Bradyrhizobium sp. WSM1253]EIG63512.1 putative dehydrogenase [Bradyrhizobium sp. WSM1253]